MTRTSLTKQSFILKDSENTNRLSDQNVLEMLAKFTVTDI